MRSIARSAERSAVIAERDRDPAGAGSRGAADAVDVALGLHRQVEVDDVRDAGDVDAAGGDVGRHQHAGPAGAEPVQRLLARGLALVAVQRLGLDARGGQVLGHLVGAVLGAGEHDHARQRRVLQQAAPAGARLPGRIARNARAARSSAACGLPGVTSTRSGSRRKVCGELARPRPAWWPRTAATGAVSAARRRSRRMSRMKPRSSMRSASSSTKWRHLVEPQVLVSIRSQMRPGVPTTMSGPRRMRCSCGRRPTPPRMTQVEIGWPWAKLRIAASICSASSRVGARIRARVENGRARRRRGGEVLQDRQREGRGLAGAGLGDAEQVMAGEQVRDRALPELAWGFRSSARRARAEWARRGRARRRWKRSKEGDLRRSDGALPALGYAPCVRRPRVTMGADQFRMRCPGRGAAKEAGRQLRDHERLKAGYGPIGAGTQAKISQPPLPIPHYQYSATRRDGRFRGG